MTRNLGGNTTIQVPNCQKVFDVTWKGDANIWYATRPMRDGEVPETATFHESSLYGAFEGKVTFVEKCRR